MQTPRFAIILALLSAFAGKAFSDTFETARRIAVGTFPRAVAVGDFNNDGKLDMVVANLGDSSVCVVLGNGNGSFQLQKVFALDGPPVAVAVGDFNGLNRWQDADPHAQKAVQLAPDIAEGHVLLGNILLRKQDAPGALREFKESLRLVPNGPLAEPTRQVVSKIEAALKSSKQQTPSK
jgi:hypothetical protein